MKLMLFMLFLVPCFAFGSELGKCSIHGVSDKSSQNSEPHRVLNMYLGDKTLSECLTALEEGTEKLKRCQVIVGGTIHYAEMRFEVQGRVLSTVDPVGIRCM